MSRAGILTTTSSRASRDAPSAGRVRVDGKHFAIGAERFTFRGATYGTFRPRADGARYPERDELKRDFAAMHDAGFTVARTYTTPPDDVVDLAADWGIRLLAGVFYPDWRYLVGCSRRAMRRVLHEGAREVREAARRLGGSDSVLALCLGNEVPADVLRWWGTERVAGAIEQLVDVARSEDDEVLLTYANYPTAEYLPLPSLDFLTFNVFLDSEHDLRRYVNRLHHLAGERPLVLGEIGLHVGDEIGEHAQAELIDSQLRVATERGVAGTCVFSWTDEWWVKDAPVEGWRFGLTRKDRSPRPALEVASEWNSRTVADLDFPWPSMSVVICAYNAEATIDECLRHTCALEYPDLEVLVIDDGSTDRTREIALRHPGARVLTIDHGGLSVARNEGFRAARGDVVAYLDSDAYPPPEWPYYLALGFDGPNVGGVGGPNLPPGSDPRGAHAVAQAPGGPVHVLTSDDRAEHIPGCNMAFWKHELVELGGFDPVFTAAGDDVDFCWRLLDRGREIAFHPAAYVWHHRRGGLRAYLRQQRGYGRSEALVEARHPDRYTPIGTARWRGRIYGAAVPTLARHRIYRGAYGAAPYQSAHSGEGFALDLLHQVGVPVAVLAAVSVPLALTHWSAGIPAAAAVLFMAGLGAVDAIRARVPAHITRGTLRFRISVAAMHLLQPLARTWGRVRHTRPARRARRPELDITGPVVRHGRRALLFALDRPREEIAAGVVACLQRVGVRVEPPTGWEDYDARFAGSTLVAGELVTSAYPEGCVQLRVRRRPRVARVIASLGLITASAFLSPIVAGVIAAVATTDVVRGLSRTGPLVHRLVEGAMR